MWYEMYRDARSPFQSGICGTALYTQRPDGLIGIVNSEQRYDDAGNLKKLRQKAKARARISNPKTNDGRLDLKFSELQPFWGNYDLLETDYTSYAIIYSCTNLLGGLYRTEYAFVLSREPILEGTPAYHEMNAKVQRVFSTNLSKPGYDLSNLAFTIQGAENGCIY